MKKVAVVTGGASGIGLAVSKQLHSDGYVVFVLDNDLGSIRKQRALIQQQDFNIEVCDVTKKKVVHEMFLKIGEKEGHIDTLFNGVGLMKMGGFSDLKEEDWDLSYQVNMKTVLNCIGSAYPYFKGSTDPNIILLSSILSETHEEKAISYTVTKSMLVSLTKTLAKDFSKDRIRVNCISPGPIQTGLLTSLVKDAAGIQGGKELLMRLSNTPLQRIGRGEDIAELVSSIIKSSFLTGSILTVDGGWSL